MTIFFLFLWYFFSGDTMKKEIVLLLLFMCSCFFVISLLTREEDAIVVQEEDRGIFISYIELGNYLRYKDKKEAKEVIQSMVSNIDDAGFNMVLLQVRTFSDSFYSSDIYPWSAVISGEEGVNPGYDLLKVFLNCCHKKDMKLFAWINPYRIRGDSDVSDLSVDNPAYSYLGTDTVFVSGGVYYNPAKEEVKQLIVDGVLELVSNYDVDGVLFDDYFYPSGDVDVVDFQNYQEENPNTSIEEFRLMQVNDLIERVYKVCHKHDVLFAVSPDGNIDNNYQKHYADVKKWGSSDGYVDYLMPQIYYGFYNETQAFVSVLEEWENLASASSVKLLPVLAFYKVGAVDTFAKTGSEEWINHDDIIMREIILTRNLKQYQGFSLFRYDYLFNPELETTTTMGEISNMKKILK